jgi:hypothetical protein
MPACVTILVIPRVAEVSAAFDDDGVHALGDEVLHLAHLPADVALRVLELDLDVAHGAGLLLDGVVDLHQEQVLEARQRHADLDGLGHGRRGAEQRCRAGGQQMGAGHGVLSLDAFSCSFVPAARPAGVTRPAALRAWRVSGLGV